MKNLEECYVDSRSGVCSESFVETLKGRITVRDLTSGDSVKSFSNGKNIFSEVVHKSYIGTRSGLRITTKSGKYLNVLPDTKIWATGFNLTDEQMIVYLMWRVDMGFRVGITNKVRDSSGISNFGQRPIHEKAKKLWILDVVENREIALEKELTYSLKYGIPTCVFCATERSLNQSRVDKIFSIFGQNGRKLLEDKHYSFSHPHWHGINSSNDLRRFLTVSVSAHNRKGTTVSFEWSENLMPLIDTLNFNGVSFTDAKNKGRYRVRKYFNAYSEAREFLELIQHIIPFSSVKESTTRVSDDKPCLITASSVFKGAKILVQSDNGAVLDEVMDVSEDIGEFFSIHVKGSMNFYGNEIITLTE